MKDKFLSPFEALPLNNESLIFNIDGFEYEGSYVHSEKIFLLGSDDSGDFVPIWEVADWKYKDKKKPEVSICIKKCAEFPKCSPCGNWFENMEEMSEYFCHALVHKFSDVLKNVCSVFLDDEKYIDLILFLGNNVYFDNQINENLSEVEKKILKHQYKYYFKKQTI
jgi:hypothetical protein